MAGKYAHIIDKLPRHLGTEPGHQVKVNAVKDAMIADPNFKRTATALARQYAEVRRMREVVKIKDLPPKLHDLSLKEALSQLQVEVDAIEQMLIDQYEVEGTTNLTLDDGDCVRIQAEPYAIVNDRESFRLWCLKQGLEREMCLPWMKTNSLIKEMLLNGEPEPPGVEAKRIDKTVFTKGR